MSLMAPHRLMLSAIVLLIGALGQLRAADMQNDGHELRSQLKVSGPKVYVRAPFGAHYRPGCAFPLEIRVEARGQDFSGDVFLCEDIAEEAARTGTFERVTFHSGQPRIFKLAARAPAVRPDLYVVVREFEGDGNISRVVFRGSLSDPQFENPLKPLPVNSRNILFCGKGSIPQLGDQSKIQRVIAREFPDEAWMYEGIDLVMLGDDTLSSVTDAGKKAQALKRWLDGGGQLFVPSIDALQSVHAAGLLPLSEPPRPERSYWIKNGVREQDVIVQSKRGYEFVRLACGFGSAVIPVPGNEDPEAARKAFEYVAAQQGAERHPDARLQSDRYKAFAYRGINPARGKGAILWFGLGALMFCLIMLLCYSSRSRIETLGLPAALIALLAVMLANFFTAPELVISRVNWLQASADGLTLRHDEWTLVEAFRHPEGLIANGPKGGSVTPLFGSTAEIRHATGELLQQPDQLNLENVEVSPADPALIYSTHLATPPASAPATFSSADGKLKFGLAQPLPPYLQRKGAVFITEKGTFHVVEGLGDTGGFRLSKFEDCAMSPPCGT
jgi:hypothetical protein